jgi:hypothetical protein
MPDFETLYPSRFTKGPTLERPLTIRIVSVRGELLEGDDGEKSKAVMTYNAAGPRDADGKPTAVRGEIVLAKTNALLIAAILGTRDFAAWAGHTVTIHYDPNVRFGKDKPGGIRVCGSPELTKTIEVKIKRPKRKNTEDYTLVPTGNDGRPRQAGAAPAPAPAPEAPPPTERPEPGSDG